MILNTNEELPTVEMRGPRRARPLPPDADDVLSTTLAGSAEDCYLLFCDVSRTPDWVEWIRSAHAMATDRDGRTARAAFVASHDSATTGFTLHYRYDDRRLLINWKSPAGIAAKIAGTALFRPLSATASMLHFNLRIDWPSAISAIPAGASGHAASSMLANFRDFVARSLVPC